MNGIHTAAKKGVCLGGLGEQQGSWGISPIFFRRFAFFERHQRRNTPKVLQVVANTDRSLYKPGETIAIHGAVLCNFSCLFEPLASPFLNEQVMFVVQVRSFNPETDNLDFPPPEFFKDHGECCSIGLQACHLSIYPLGFLLSLFRSLSSFGVCVEVPSLVHRFSESVLPVLRP